MNDITLTNPVKHPANGPLTLERITRIIAELRRFLEYQNGGDMAYVIADAIKGLEELRVSKEAASKPVGNDELDHLIWGFQREGFHARTLAALVELREVRKAKGEPVAVINGAREPVLYGEHIGIAIGTHLYAVPPAPVTPDCWCLACRPVTMSDMRFVVCPDCGNKRCPRANDHNNACTGSNELGQIGSAYPTAPQEVK